jgi:hypothetical protein
VAGCGPDIPILKEAKAEIREAAEANGGRKQVFHVVRVGLEEKSLDHREFPTFSSAKMVALVEWTV